MSGKGFGLFFEMGCGKSLTALAIMGALWEQGLIRRVLVIAPGSVVSVWEDELKKFADFPYAFSALLGTKAQRLKKLAALEGLGAPGGHALRSADGFGTELLVAGINYESVWRDEIFEALLRFGPELVICDESQRIKNHKAQQTVAAVELAKRAKYRLALSGTPITHDAQDLFSQYSFIDPAIFGENFYAYRNRYCLLGGFGGKQVIGTKNEDELSNRMYSIAYRVTKKEALDLPPETYVVRTVELSPKERKLYDDMRRNAYAELSEQAEVSATTVLTKRLRLQQLVGGFIRADGDTHYTQVGSSKIDAVADILDDYVILEGRKLVIFAVFLPEIDAICRLLTSRGIKHVCMTGAVPMENRGELKDRFQNDPETMVFVAQTHSAGLGITLHSASAALFYSVNDNWEDFQQATARIHRKGQHYPCTYILLQAAKSIDQKIAADLDSKTSVADRICNGSWKEYFA